MKMKIIKFSKDLIVPNRAHYNDAGLDCYALEDFDIAPMEVYANTNNTVVVPLGFGLEIPDGYMVTIRPRSSMNIKGIITQIGTIDSGYRGEIKAAFINTTHLPISISKGDKICQIVIEPVTIVDLVDDLGEERKDGGFGSTGK